MDIIISKGNKSKRGAVQMLAIICLNIIFTVFAVDSSCLELHRILLLVSDSLGYAYTLLSGQLMIEDSFPVEGGNVSAQFHIPLYFLC